MAQPLSSADFSIFSLEISNFYFIKKCSYRLHFNTKFLILLTFFESLKVVLINILAILMMMSAKLATLGLLKIYEFWKKVMTVIIVYDVTNKTLWRDSSCIVDLVMWPTCRTLEFLWEFQTQFYKDLTRNSFFSRGTLS